MQFGYCARVGAFFGAIFLIYGVHLPFLPLWLEWRGLTAAEISIVVAVPFFLRIGVSPSVAFFSDRSGRHGRSIILLAFWSAAMAALLAQLSGFFAILLAAVALSLAMTTIMPLTEVIAVQGVRSHGCDYGRMRLWGSLTFILASSLASVFIGWLGVRVVVWLILAGCLITAIAALFLPEDQGASGSDVDGAAVMSLAAIRSLVLSPVFLLFLLACGLVQAAHATYYAFSAIHWSRQGLSAEVIGGLWALGVIAEIGLFAWSGAVTRRFTAGGLMIIGAASSVVRWSAMAFDPGVGVLVVLQSLHALTFGASHLAAIRFISQAVDPRLAGTAQALYATTAMGVAMGAATLASGLVYERIGGATFLLMAAFAGVGLIAALGVLRNWDGGLLVDLERPAEARP
mgnify:FL=1